MASKTFEEFTVAWIAAPPHGRAAATMMLDDRFDQPTDFKKNINDPNSYVWGRIEKHHVVIASLPAGEYGTTTTAITAQGLRSSLPDIRIGFLVGIGAGVPGETYSSEGIVTVKRDIRLGDVVVSSPDASSGGVVQYDFIKAKESLERVGTLNSPPQALRNALATLQAEHEFEETRIPDIVAASLERYPKASKTFRRPGTAHDMLFRGSYNHAGGEDCQDCLEIEQIKRPLREDLEIHYGTIASGNTLVKDAMYRDKIVGFLRSVGVEPLCFEMEAAGLMNTFPCLVIRGICNYGDSHKNDAWQRYAALTAAAFAKEYLSFVDVDDVRRDPRLGQVLKKLDTLGGGLEKLCELSKSSANALQTHAQATTDFFIRQEMRYESGEHSKCHQVFKTSNYEQVKDINPDRVEHTCQWAFTHHLYQQWAAINKNALLWIFADPGCGKSVLSKCLVNEVLKESSNNTTICYFFFKDNEEQNSEATALCAILHQLFSSQPHLLHHAMAAWRSMKDKAQRESGELWRILLAATSDPTAHDTICVLDALDEIGDNYRDKLIDRLTEFHKQHGRSSLKFICTSRPYDDIRRGFRKTMSLPTIQLRGEHENDQIRSEIDRVTNLSFHEHSRSS